jgi:hypothetical protein
MHSEEAKIVAGPESWNDQFLLGLGWSGFFEDAIDLIEAGASGYGGPSDCTIVRKHVLTRGLDRGDGTGLGLGRFDELHGATAGLAAHVKVVADQVYKGLAADERRRAVKGIAIPAGNRLLHEGQQPSVIAGSLPVRLLAAGAYDNADLFHAGGNHLFQDYLKSGLFHAIQIDEALEGEAILVGTSGSDDGLAYGHVAFRER